MLSAFKIGKTVFNFSRTYIMGIVNVTPDSFSDGGQYLNVDTAMRHIERLVLDGADIIDIGAESSRPGSELLDTQVEINRLQPILELYKKYFSTPLSLDTTKSHVAEFGISNGVDMINDVSGFRFDPDLPGIINRYDVPVVLMHMRGNPKNMQDNPVYRDVVSDVIDALKESLEIAKNHRIERIIIDPGIGFGKKTEHNLQLIKHLNMFSVFEKPILIGTSRKSFIGAISGGTVSERLGGTISSSIISVLNGANFVRVHDVKEVKQALQIADAILGAD